MIIHKNESLVTIIHPFMCSWVKDDIKDVGFGFVLIVAMQLDIVRDFIH